jgi:tetratricopeptide (TPR) repeat protein
VWLADIAAVAGDYERASQYGRQAVNAFHEQGHLAFEASYGGRLGRWLCILGRFDEAEPLAEVARSIPVQEADWLWRQVQARVYAHRGEHGAAEHLMREAIASVEKTDMLDMHGGAYWDLAEVLAASGRADEAVTALEEAIGRYERKRNLAMVAQLTPKLSEFRRTAGTAAV